MDLLAWFQIVSMFILVIVGIVLLSPGCGGGEPFSNPQPLPQSLTRLVGSSP